MEMDARPQFHTTATGLGQDGVPVLNLPTNAWGDEQPRQQCQQAHNAHGFGIVVNSPPMEPFQPHEEAANVLGLPTWNFGADEQDRQEQQTTNARKRRSELEDGEVRDVLLPPGW
jgi:hypothetical protein